MLLTYLYKDVCTCISGKTDRTYMYMYLHLQRKPSHVTHRVYTLHTCTVYIYVYIHIHVYKFTTPTISLRFLCTYMY